MNIQDTLGSLAFKIPQYVYCPIKPPWVETFESITVSKEELTQRAIQREIKLEDLFRQEFLYPDSKFGDQEYIAMTLLSNAGSGFNPLIDGLAIAYKLSDIRSALVPAYLLLALHEEGYRQYINTFRGPVPIAHTKNIFLSWAALASSTYVFHSGALPLRKASFIISTEERISEENILKEISRRHAIPLVDAAEVLDTDEAMRIWEIQNELVMDVPRESISRREGSFRPSTAAEYGPQEYYVADLIAYNEMVSRAFAVRFSEVLRVAKQISEALGGIIWWEK